MCSSRTLRRARWSVWEQPAALLPFNYIEAIQRAGGLAVMLPPDERVEHDAGQLLELIDGLVLAGGADIDAGAYGEAAHAAEPRAGSTDPCRCR